jgi:glycosyltransferase involved in cell wall biosynthesis
MTDPAHRSLADTPRVHARVSAIVPARNEALCIGSVVRGLLRLRSACGLPLIFEVVVADNGSSDTTAEVALAAGARVLHVPQPGYGNACWHAAQASRGDVLLFVDGDGAADPQDASVLLAALDRGADLVIGVRQRPEPGAMSAAQRFGNALACTLMRWLWRMPVSDLGPYRAIRRDAFDALDLHDRSFGWTVEMQVRAFVLAQRVVERPVAWHARAAGVSKISGTLRGVFGAGIGILGMIARLWWHERQRAAPPATKKFSPGTQSATAAPAHLLPPH